jgi:ribonuclease BN (tRNA processing enzyme)
MPLRAMLIPLLLLACTHAVATTDCGNAALALQVLGSGGPEIGDQRASSSYLLWRGGRAEVLIDTGPGSALHFEQLGARLEDLQTILYSHYHTDHSSDFAAFAKAMYFSDRIAPLAVFGPPGNDRFPSTEAFLARTIGPQGSYAYLNDYLIPDRPGQFHFQAKSVQAGSIELAPGLTATPIPVNHGPVPALAWKLTADKKTILISGDLSNPEALSDEAQNATLIVAHHAIPEQAGPLARQLHATPSQLARLAAQSQTKHVVLSHLMRRSLAQKQKSLAIIRQAYKGKISFAEDLDCYPLR